MSAPPKEALEKIQLLATDCDGTLTDGTLIYDQDGDDQHSFNVRDGHGLVLLRMSGVKLVLITGRPSEKRGRLGFFGDFCGLAPSRAHSSSTTGLLSTPIFSISTSTKSPCFRY